MSSRNGIIGCRPGPSSIPAPPLTNGSARRRWRNRCAKRTGGFVAAACATILPVSAARNGNDSSQGKVNEMPAPQRKRNVRREQAVPRKRRRGIS